MAEIKLQIIPFFISMSTFEQYCIDKNQVVLGFGLSYSLSFLALVSDKEREESVNKLLDSQLQLIVSYIAFMFSFY